MTAGKEDGYVEGGIGTSWETAPRCLCGPARTVLYPSAYAASGAASDWGGTGRGMRRVGEGNEEGRNGKGNRSGLEVELPKGEVVKWRDNFGIIS